MIAAVAACDTFPIFPAIADKQTNKAKQIILTNFSPNFLFDFVTRIFRTRGSGFGFVVGTVALQTRDSGFYVGTY